MLRKGFCLYCEDSEVIDDHTGKCLKCLLKDGDNFRIESIISESTELIDILKRELELLKGEIEVMNEYCD